MPERRPAASAFATTQEQVTSHALYERETDGRYVLMRTRAQDGHLLLVERWRRWMLAQGLSPRTIGARLATIERLASFTSTDPAAASTGDIADYMASLGEHLSKASRSTYFAHLKAWFVWLVVTEHRPDNPIAVMPTPKTPKLYPRPITDRELEVILATRMRPRTRMMVLLGAYQGLRRHEIAKIRGDDVNLADLQLRVIGKGGLDRVLPLHPRIAAEARARHYPERGWWFPTAGGNQHGAHGPVLAQSVGQLIANAFERAGVQGGAHRLRHWYGTSLVRNGANLRVVQELMRHQSLQTTQIYTLVSYDEQRAAIDSLPTP